MKLNVCKIDKWHHLNNKVWNDYFIDEDGNVWHNDIKLEQFSYTVYDDKRRFGDTRPYVTLPSQRGSSKVPVHILQMQSTHGYVKGMDVCHLNGDKFDNRRNNLEYMTRSDHRKYDGIQSEKLESNVNPDLSYRESPTYQAHHSGWTSDGVGKGLHWFNDGVKNYRCKTCPKGCVAGML